ncbi:ATP-binding protein, partial [archaeon]|nr:ATP-binding protein [archaeon]
MARTKRKFETSLTLDYRRNARGIERIVLDSISNHLPADSKGKNTSIKFKQEDKWIDFKEYNPEKSVQEIIFEDDGQGYDARLLTVLFSSKTEDVLSVGQFGEGLKLVAAACLRNGIKVEYKSQNWTATPYAKPEKIGDHDLERLCFEVKENGTHVQGSRTRFIEPSKKLIEEILNLPEKVLFFNDEYKELYGRPTISGNFSRVIDLNKKQRSVFIKGVKIKNVNSLFSYDLGLENISPDRASFDEDKILDEIERLLRGCENTELIKQIIRYAKEHPQAPV